jgi:hypothetical protein
MSSPGARQRRRREQYQAPRSRREVAIAVGAALFIVAATAFMIWLLRPGGIADRQPRSSWLLGIAFFAVAIACYVILRPSSRLKVDRRLALAGSLGLIVVVAVVAGFAWPGGLLRHTPKPFTPTATTQSPATATTTTVATTTSTIP